MGEIENILSLTINIKHLHTLTGHNGSVYQLQKAGESTFLSAGGDGWIVKWDLNSDNVETGKLIAKTDTQIFSLLYEEDSNLLVAGDMHGELHFINTLDKERTRRFKHHKKGVFGLKIINRDLYTLGGDGMLSKWTLENIGQVESMKISGDSLRSIAVSESIIYVGASDKSIFMIDINTETVVDVANHAHENSVFSLAFDPNLQHLLSGGRDAMLNVWTEGTSLNIYKGITAHLFTINSIQFNPSGKLFATASRDKTIKIWDAKSYKLLKVIEAIRDLGHVNSVNHLLWLSESILISCSDDRTIKVWEINYKT